MLIWAWWALSTSVKALEVNWLALSVLKNSGVSYLVIASLRASVQKSVLMVLDSRHAVTRRVTRSRIATR